MLDLSKVFSLDCDLLIYISMVCFAAYYVLSAPEEVPNVAPRPLSNSEELLFHIRRQLVQNRVLAATFYNLVGVNTRNGTLSGHDSRAFMDRWPTFVPTPRAPNKLVSQEVCVHEAKIEKGFRAQDEVELDQELWLALDTANKFEDNYYLLATLFTATALHELGHHFVKVTLNLPGIAKSFEVDGKSAGQEIEQLLLGGSLQASCKRDDHGNVSKILQLWLVNRNDGRIVLAEEMKKFVKSVLHGAGLSRLDSTNLPIAEALPDTCRYSFNPLDQLVEGIPKLPGSTIGECGSVQSCTATSKTVGDYTQVTTCAVWLVDDLPCAFADQY